MIWVACYEGSGLTDTETQHSSGNLRRRGPEIRNLVERYVYRHERHILDEQARVG